MPADPPPRLCLDAIFHLPCSADPGTCIHVHRDHNDWPRAIPPRIRDGKLALKILHGLMTASLKHDGHASAPGATETVGENADGDAHIGARADPSALPPSPAPTPTTGTQTLPSLLSPAPPLLPSLPPSPAPRPTIDIDAIEKVRAGLSVEGQEAVALREEGYVLRKTVGGYEAQVKRMEGVIEQLRADVSVEEDALNDLTADLAKARSDTKKLQRSVRKLQGQDERARKEIAKTHAKIISIANLLSESLSAVFGTLLYPATIEADGGLRTLLSKEATTTGSLRLLQLTWRCVDVAVHAAREAFNHRLFMSTNAVWSRARVVGAGEGGAEGEEEGSAEEEEESAVVVVEEESVVVVEEEEEEEAEEESVEDDDDEEESVKEDAENVEEEEQDAESVEEEDAAHAGSVEVRGW